MAKALAGLLISLGFLVPALASASVTITSATLNNGSSVQVDPGGNITVSVTAELTDSSKWKGVNWGVSTGSVTGTCVNTKNAKEGTRNNDEGVFTETFTIKAPGQPGLYNANFIADAANNCGKQAGGVFALSGAVRVGTNTVPPVIAAHSDISVQLADPASGSVVGYVNPPATDHYGNLVAVDCAPASGYFFPVGNTLVSCTAADSWGNAAIPSSFTVSVLPPADTEAPAIAAHEDVFATTTEDAVEVAYALPAATDNVDASVEVSCAPASGSAFAVGTTTVSCAAQDAAGNGATSTFSVIVEQVAAEPELYVMASQPDESYLCGESTGTWRQCDLEGASSFTDTPESSVATIDLGPGSGMGGGVIQTVTLSKDWNYGEWNLFHPWLITISCFADASHAASCPDWEDLSDTIHLNPSGDGEHWVADFSALGRAFNPDEYYVMTVDDREWDTPAYGSESLQEPYWVITGLR
jgi:hypothetical protein